MNELHFAFRVKQHLNQSLQEIDGDKLARLKAARETALAAQKKPAAMPLLAGAGYAFRFHFDSRGVRFSLAALLLVLATAVYVFWQGDLLIAEISDFDSALLTDDVPLEALLDEDFDKWLKNSQQR